MNKMPEALEPADELAEPDFKRWTAEEVRQLVGQSPLFSVWNVIGWQVAVGAAVALVAWLINDSQWAAISAGYGALAVILPAIVFARGVFRKKNVFNAGAALGSFFLWELVKIILTLAMLLAAPKLILNLSWLALFAGFIVTMKVYWVTLFLGLVRGKSVVKLKLLD